ncbi:MAG: helix-turn-helix domain-containing protein [Chloroflexi bacterium]|nr:helix-turn-helix domain-containing protein [Chloroflexota bacterium]
MKLNIEERESDSPFVERIWRAQSGRVDTFISIAFSRLDLVFWTYEGKTIFTVRGPETKATIAPVPEESESFGIVLKPGVFMPHLPVSELVDSDATLPPAADHSFYLKGSAWQYPDYENAETFINRLIRDEVLVQEPIINDVLNRYMPDLSLRTIQRRFVQATGLTHRTMQRIEQARTAAVLLQQGASILDTVFEAGYFDQPHLTRSMKHFIGLTPTQIMDNNRPEQLSFLYKTDHLLSE